MVVSMIVCVVSILIVMMIIWGFICGVVGMVLVGVRCEVCMLV